MKAAELLSISCLNLFGANEPLSLSNERAYVDGQYKGSITVYERPCAPHLLSLADLISLAT